MLPKKQPWEQAQTTWATQLDPVISNELINGILLPSMPLNNGTTVINHRLGRQPQGWFLVAPQGAAIVYQASQQPNPTLTLTVVSNAAITTGFWVF